MVRVSSTLEGGIEGRYTAGHLKLSTKHPHGKSTAAWRTTAGRTAYSNYSKKNTNRLQQIMRSAYQEQRRQR